MIQPMQCDHHRGSSQRTLWGVALGGLAAATLSNPFTMGNRPSAVCVAAEMVDWEQTLSVSGTSDSRIGSDVLGDLKAASRLAAQGETSRAIDAYRVTYGTLKKQLDKDDHPLLLEILGVVSDLFLEIEDFPGAESPLVRQIELRSSRLAQDAGDEAATAVEASVLAATQIKLGVVLSRMGRLAEAAVRFREGIDWLEHHLGKSDPLVLESRLLECRNDWICGRFTQATQSTEQILGLLGQASSPRTAITPYVREDLGEMYLSLGHSKQARELWENALAATDSRVHDDSPQRITCYRNSGRAWAAAGDLQTAEDYWRQAQRLSAQCYGTRSGEWAVDTLSLAIAAEIIGDHLAAQTLFDDGIRVLRDGASRATRNQVHFVRWATRLLVDAGRHARAQQLLELLISVDRERPGVGATELNESKIALARCRLLSQNPTAAEGLLSEALTASREALGDQHIQTLEIFVLQARTAVAQGRSDLATSLGKLLCDSEVERLNREHETELVEAIADIANLLTENGDTSAADDLRARWLSMRETQYGVEGIELVDTLTAFADSFQAVGNSDRAIPLYLRAVTLSERAAGPDSPEVAAVLLPLARAYRAQRREPDAQAAARRALRIWEMSVGPIHVVTTETLKLLAASLYASGHHTESIPFYERLLQNAERQHGSSDLRLLRIVDRLIEVSREAHDEERVEKYRRQAAGIEAQNKADPAPPDPVNETRPNSLRVQRRTSAPA